MADRGFGEAIVSVVYKVKSEKSAMSPRVESFLRVLGFAFGICLGNALLCLLLAGLFVYFESAVWALLAMWIVLFAIPLLVVVLFMRSDNEPMMETQ